MKPAPLVALGLALNRGKSPYFVLISGRYTSRGRPDHLTPSEHSDRGCGEADSGRRYRAPHGRTAAARQRTSRGGLKAAKAIVPETRRDGGGAEPATSDASIRTNPEARARIQAFVERRGALRRLAPQLLRVVPLGDDSVEFGPVDLGHDPRIHLLLAEVGRRHHAERREQAALDGSVVLEQRLIGNGSLVALDRLEDGAADEPDLLVQRLRHPLLDFGEAIERAVLEARRVEALTSGLSGKSTADLLSAGGGVGSRGLDRSVGLDRHGLSSCWLGHANVMRRRSARRGSASNSFGPGCRRVGETYPTIVSCRPTPPSRGLRQ